MGGLLPFPRTGCVPHAPAIIPGTPARLHSNRNCFQRGGATHYRAGGGLIESEFAAIPPEKRVEAAAFHIPLAYREGPDYTHLGNQVRAYEQTYRPGPGHTGPTYPEDSRVRAAPRLGDRAAPETSLRRRPTGQRRITLPCSAQAGAGGLDQGRVEAERE